MIHPSYNELVAVMNSNSEGKDKPLVSSRYSVCIATAKRARQLIDGAEPFAKSKCNKPLSIAVEEFYENKVTVVDDEDTSYEADNEFFADVPAEEE